MPGFRIGNGDGTQGLVATDRIDGRDHVRDAAVQRRQILPGGRIQHIIERHFAGRENHLAGLPADVQCADLPLVHPVQIPLIVGHVLEVPHQFTGAGTQGQGGVGIQGRIGNPRDAQIRHQRRGVVGGGCAEVHQVQLRIVTAGYPHRAAAAAVQRQIVPGVATGGIGSRHRVKAPALFTGSQVQAHDETTLGQDSGTNTLDHHAVGNDRRSAQ